MTTDGVVLSGLGKRFGRLEVLRNIDGGMRAGRITAVVGPNAAGKTTLIKIILGLVMPDRGTVTVDGDVVGREPAYRARIGYMPQAARFPEQLTGREILALLRGLRGATQDGDDELIHHFRLEPHLDTPIRALSGGTRQKLNASIAFLFRPAILILDEPTAGLDPVAAGILKTRILRAAAEGATVILTSHIMSEIEELAHDLVFLVEGAIVYRGTARALLEATGAPRLEAAIASLLAPAAP